VGQPDLLGIGVGDPDGGRDPLLEQVREGPDDLLIGDVGGGAVGVEQVDGVDAERPGGLVGALLEMVRLVVDPPGRLAVGEVAEVPDLGRDGDLRLVPGPGAQRLGGQLLAVLRGVPGGVVGPGGVDMGDAGVQGVVDDADRGGPVGASLDRQRHVAVGDGAGLVGAELAVLHRILLTNGRRGLRRPPDPTRPPVVELMEK
jgi:hypothetical protein